MTTSFHRMKPTAQHMAVEGAGPHAVGVLCVECGWEAEVKAPTAPWVAFKDHPCRMVFTVTGTDW